MYRSYRDSGSERRGGGKKFGFGSYGRGGGGRTAMHGAICGMCHKPCEVPFMPNGKKPVYCASCFRKNDRGESHGFEERRPYKPEYPGKSESSGTANFNEQFKVLNEKLDAIIEVLND